MERGKGDLRPRKRMKNELIRLRFSVDELERLNMTLVNQRHAVLHRIAGLAQVRDAVAEATQAPMPILLIVARDLA